MAHRVCVSKSHRLPRSSPADRQDGCRWAPEREVVLLADSRALGRLPAVLRAEAREVSSGPQRMLRDQYLDTTRWLLYRCGVACRLRVCGKRHTLTLKRLAPFRNGYAERTEIEEDLPAPPPAWPALLPGPALRRILRPAAPCPVVRKLFELRQVRRTFSVVTHDGALLEVAASRVRIHGRPDAGERADIEIEWVSGPAGTLQAFSSRVRAALGLDPERESKFSFGLRAAGLTPPGPQTPGRGRIGPADPLQAVATREIGRHLRRLLWNEPGTCLGIEPERLHDMRVAVRRLRVALRLFRDVLPPGAVARLRRELQWIGRSLGSVRDLDVHLEQARADGRRLPAKAQSALPRFLEEVQRQREQRQQALLSDLRGKRYAELKRGCHALVARLRRPLARRPLPVALAGSAMVERDMARVSHASRAASDGQLHRFRIRCKRLRYLCDALADVYGKPARRMARRLAGLQETLGRHQDAVEARRFLAALLAQTAVLPPASGPVSLAAGHLLLLRERDRRRFREKARGAWRRFVPRRLQTRLLAAVRRARRDLRAMPRPTGET